MVKLLPRIDPSEVLLFRAIVQGILTIPIMICVRANPFGPKGVRMLVYLQVNKHKLALMSNVWRFFWFSGSGWLLDGDLHFYWIRSTSGWRCRHDNLLLSHLCHDFLACNSSGTLWTLSSFHHCFADARSDFDCQASISNENSLRAKQFSGKLFHIFFYMKLHRFVYIFSSTNKITI